MKEYRFFEEGTIPEFTTPEWYETRERAPHLEQVGHRGRLLLAAELVNIAISRGAESVCDLGAGDGGLLTLLGIENKWGYDLQPSNIQGAAERGVEILLGNVVDNPKYLLMNSMDVLVMTEFLEHLVDPRDFLLKCRRSSARWVVASSPCNETPESHYENHCWGWDTEAYSSMLAECGWRVVETRIARKKYQVVLCECI